MNELVKTTEHNGKKAVSEAQKSDTRPRLIQLEYEIHLRKLISDLHRMYGVEGTAVFIDDLRQVLSELENTVNQAPSPNKFKAEQQNKLGKMTIDSIALPFVLEIARRYHDDKSKREYAANRISELLKEAFAACDEAYLPKIKTFTN